MYTHEQEHSHLIFLNGINEYYPILKYPLEYVCMKNVDIKSGGKKYC